MKSIFYMQLLFVISLRFKWIILVLPASYSCIEFLAKNIDLVFELLIKIIPPVIDKKNTSAKQFHNKTDSLLCRNNYSLADIWKRYQKKKYMCKDEIDIRIKSCSQNKKWTRKKVVEGERCNS